MHSCFGISGRSYQPGNGRQNILPFVFQVVFGDGIIGLKDFENIGYLFVGKKAEIIQPKISGESERPLV